jgi:exopolysaccharide production protein ExoQ
VRLGRFAPDAFVALVVALQVGILAPWFGAGRGGSDGLVVQAAFAAVYAVAALLLLLRVVRRRRVRWTRWLLWPLAYLGLAAASLLWSDLPALTLRRTVALAGTLLLAWWWAETLGPRRLLRGVAFGLLLVAAASYALLLLAPQVAVHGGASQHAGDVRGALLHKNLLGREMALATTLALGLAAAAPRRRPGWLLAAVATAGLVAGAGSATGLVALLGGLGVVTLAALPAANAWERAGRAALVAGAVAGAALLVAAAAPRLLGWLGRDTSFTGRDRIWEVTVGLLRDRPWTGFGYGAFWEGPGGAEVSRQLGYAVGHAHNGLLQAATSLGVLGAAALLLLFGGAAWRALRAPAFRSVRPAALGLLVHVALLSITDAVMSGPNSLSLTVVLTFVLVRAGAPPAEART